MPFVGTPNGVQVEFLSTWSGQHCETVTHYDLGATPITIATLTLFGQDLNAWYRDTIVPFLSQDITFTGTRVTDIRTAFGPVVDVPLTTPAVGGVATQSVVNNAAIVMTKRSTSRGRSYRGRVYQPGIPKADESTSVDMNGTDVAGLVAGWVTLIARAVGDGAVLAILSKVTGGSTRVAGLLKPVASLDADTHFDSQRRRLAG